MYAEGSTLKPPPSLRIDSAVIEKSGSRTLIDKLFCEDVPPGWPSFRLKFAKEKHKQEHEDSLRGFPKYEPGCGITDCDYLRRHLGLEKHRRIPTTERIYHEIYIAWPGPECMVHSTMWHIATRNFFSILLGARSLVGITLYESWVWLLDRFAMDPDYLDRNTDRVAWITDYLVRYKFTDVRNNPSYAASLLAFSERYQWREGYIEAFVHCVGMLTLGVKTIPEWRYIQPLTKQFLENASMEQDLRIHYAQNFLRSFDLSRMWPTCSAPPSSARGAFNRLQKWLCRYYEAVFGQWPPNSGERWLKLEHMKRLQTDFYGLYDYLVDREVQFELIDPSKNTWAITHQNNVNFRSDTNELAFKDIVVGFDDRYGFPHIPHPYPNTPSSAPVYGKPKSASPFSMKKPPTPSELQVLTKRKALSYAKASNVYSTPGQCMNAELVAHFAKFEQEDMLDSLDPFEARLGRWILIYGVLQILATLAVYSPNLQYAEGCHYFLSPQMKGLVPWSLPGSPPEEEAEHTRSHCWTVPKTWDVHMHQSRKSPYQPIVLDQYGDGRAHDEFDDEVEKVIPAPKAQATESDIAHMRTDNNSHKRAEEWGADSHKANPDYNVEQSPHEHGVLHNRILPEDGLGGPDIDNHDNHDGLGLDEERSGGHPTEPSRRRRIVSIFTDDFVPIGWTEEELQELRGG